MYWESESNGKYLIGVKLVEEDSPAGKYQKTVKELRPAQAQDIAHVEAEKSYAQAEELLAERKAASLKIALTKYQASLPNWRAAHDLNGEANAFARIGAVNYLLSDMNQALENFL